MIVYKNTHFPGCPLACQGDCVQHLDPDHEGPLPYVYRAEGYVSRYREREVPLPLQEDKRRLTPEQKKKAIRDNHMAVGSVPSDKSVPLYDKGR